jgi:thiol-disulfide isomerase/thioredoxin
MIVLAILILPSLAMAQQEIPDKIKDIMLQGITAIDSAKVPADVDKALVLFKEAAKLAPDFPDVHYYIGKTLALMQGNTRNAVKELQKYLKAYPNAADKESVLADIAKLMDALKARHETSLVGVDLFSLPYGIYVERVYSKSLQSGDWRLQRLREGDKILKINGDDLSGLSLNDVLNKIDDASSGNVTLTAQRNGKSFEATIALEKASEIKWRELGEDDLNEIISDSEKITIVLWVTDNCNDCLKYYPPLSDILEKYDSKIHNVTVNLDKNKMIGDDFGINKNETPVIGLFKKGILVEKIVGFNQAQFEEKVEAIMK